MRRLSLRSRSIFLNGCVERYIERDNSNVFQNYIFSSFFFLLKGILVDSRRKRKKFYRMQFIPAIILNEEDYYSAEYR